MSKVTRKAALIFSGSAGAGPNGIAEFGSLANGSVVYSTDPDVIQSLPQWLGGWNPALVGGASPALEDMNAVEYVNSYQVAYLLQQGIPEYNATTTYYTNSFCAVDSLIYVSLIDNNVGHSPGSSPTQWTLFSGVSGKGFNALRNSTMIVAQRGTSGTIVASTPAYTVDGWIVDAVGNNCAWAQVLSTVNNVASLRLTPSGTLTDLYIKQRIESSVMQQIGYTNVTIQAYVYNGTLGNVTPTLALNVPTLTDNYGSVTSVLAATNLQTIPPGTGGVVAYTFAVTSANAFEKGLEVIWDFGNQVPSTKNIQFTFADLSPTPNFTTGLITNPPIPQVTPVGVEMQNSFRYLNVLQGGDAIFGAAGDATHFCATYYFKNRMRNTPSITVVTVGNFHIYGNTNANIATVTSLTIVGGGGAFVSLNSVILQALVAAGLTADVPGYLIDVGDSSPVPNVFFSAEL